MKKIIIILITIFVFTTNIYALENISYTISGTNKSLCSKDGKNFLEIPSIDLDGKESYILKPMESFNTNLKTYEYAKYSNYDLPEDLKDYFYAFLEYKNIPGISHSNYHILTQRLIWDYLYPEMEIRFCTNRGKPFEFLEEEYYKVKDMITEHIKRQGYINRSTVQELCGFTDQQARRTIEKMKEENIIEMYHGGRYAKYILKGV